VIEHRFVTPTLHRVSLWRLMQRRQLTRSRAFLIGPALLALGLQPAGRQAVGAEDEDAIAGLLFSVLTAQPQRR
jgi:hypothetical protein